MLTNRKLQHKEMVQMELRKIIKNKGIKQSWVANRLGISKGYLSMLLNRKRRLTKEMETHFSLLIDHIKGERR